MSHAKTARDELAHGKFLELDFRCSPGKILIERLALVQTHLKLK